MESITSKRKIDLINIVEKLEKKISDLTEENRLLMLQQDTDDDDVVDVTVPITKPKKKKLRDMDEFELARHMSRKTSIRQL